MTRADAKRVYRELGANALATDMPSQYSSQLLNRLGLAEQFRKDPDSGLAALHAGLAPSGDEDRVFALAELSFLDGEKRGTREQALAATVYAYAFLFPDGLGAPPDLLDPRLQIARNIYNRGVGLALASPGERAVILANGAHALPVGRLDVVFDPKELVWTAGYQLDDLVPLAEYEVRGLSNRYRTAGLGAPLAGSLAPVPGAKPSPGAELLPPRLRVPVTAFLRIENARRHLRDGALRGDLELYALDEDSALELDGKRVPLERETTAPLAYMLEGAPIWDFEFAGFRSGDFLPGGIKSQLVMMRPHRPGRIPVVLVHGTASSPARWAEMVNEFENDPAIATRYEVWHRGSYLASFSVSNLVTRLISAPLRITKLSVDLVTQNQDEMLTRKLERMPTSLDNMRPGNPFLQKLSALPIDPHVTAHSIVAVQGDGPVEEGGDGVVKYASAHIDGVESELIVRSSHSAQANPATINEVKRILITHAGVSGEQAPH